MKKTIFITGASSGLGKATALLFAAKGWNVIASMRKPQDAKDLAGHGNIQVVALDVTDASRIEPTVQEVLKTNTVDVVFNNAGYGLGGCFEGASDEDVQRQINTNLLGVMRVTRAFLPHFRQNKKGLFITTTSIGGYVAFPLFSVYHATKWALEGWSESLYYELDQLGIGVKTVAPGGIRTDFAGRSLTLATHPAYKTMIDKAVVTFSDPKRQKDYSNAEQIAETIYAAATDGKKQLRYIAGKDANTLYTLRRWMGYGFFMKQIQKAFFK
jgi:NAD(P)-dependent dehydrogenase (short-subunit alcohol dehydrogenase family)